MRVAAIDQGTTSTRALVLDKEGGARIELALRHTQHHPRSGWVEHDPNELLANVRACLTASGAVDAIGIANQGESCLAWDARTRKPLSPVVVWQDNRTADTIERLKSAGAESETLERAGLPLDAYFSASKLAWIIDNTPPAQEALRAGRLRIGTTDAFFLDHLTGVFATDVTTASRTSLMNLATEAWDEELCLLFGVPGEALPDIRPTVGDFGVLDGTPVTASVVDQQAALFGHGCRNAGDAKITFGTGAFALAVTGRQIVRAPQHGLLPTVAWRIGKESTFALDGGVFNAGSAVEWAGRLRLFDGIEELSAFDAPPAISRNLAFVPALSGLACPHWDRSASAVWIGMTADTTRRDLCQALLEGIALRTAEVVAAMHERVAISERISIDGGLTRSPYFTQFLADVLQRPLLLPAFDELTALGCAMLARGAGSMGGFGPRKAAVITPRKMNAAHWRACFAEAVNRSRGWRGTAGGAA